MTEAIIDKIRKLIAFERSARNPDPSMSDAAKACSIAEAAAFAERIHALLIEHKLSMADIDMTEETRSPIGEEVHYKTPEQRPMRKRAHRWYDLLFDSVAEAHFCQSIHEIRFNMVHLVGREEDRAIAIAMFQYLLATMKRLASQERLWRKAQRRSVRNFTNSFYRGFVGAIYHRYAEAREKADQTESTALVLVRADNETKARAAELHPGMFLEKRKKLKNRVNKAAHFSGWMSGKEVSLASNVLDPANETKGLLGE